MISTQYTYNEIIEKFFLSEYIGEYSLSNIRKACEHFGNPQNQFKCIHIAGTNGKGSVAKMLFQILKESGQKVWVYTSPHNIDIRERFETDTWLISEEKFVSYATIILGYKWELSYYERCTLVAFLYFRDMGCEYAIIEVGLWGRLDSTNIITPILSIITSISYDHMEFLGNTLEQIAWEKWGIIKPWIPVILYGSNPTLENIAHKQWSAVIFPKNREISTNLLGKHQISNARIAFEAGIFLWIPDRVIQHALTQVDHPGRLQYIRSNLLIDWAHNEDGLKKLHTYLASEKWKWDNIIYCFNLKSGKHAHLVLDIFHTIENWNVIQSKGFQVSDAITMQAEILQLGKHAHIITPENIFLTAEKNPNILYVVFWSLYMLREFLEK